MRVGNGECDKCQQAHPIGQDCTAAPAATFQGDGWTYDSPPENNGDARRLVTLEQGGMTWVGIRAWHHSERRWYNGGDPEQATVKAWKPLDEPARGFWYRGQLQMPG